MGVFIVDYFHLQKVKHNYLRSRNFKGTITDPC